jgi:ribosomal protein S18 acetylase RimI-like enzyme
MLIRQATTKDIPAIQHLNRQLDEHHVRLLPDIFQSVAGNARPDSLIAEWIGDPDADYLLAEVEGEIVGFVNVRKSSHPDYPVFRPRHFAQIGDAVVDGPKRGKGIGKELFEAATRWARERGVRFLQVTVWHENAGARAFYLEQGFRPMTMRMELDIEGDSKDAHGSSEPSR